MKKLVAISSFSYGGRRLKLNEEFTAKDKDAKTLILIGRALSAESKTENKKPVVKVETPAVLTTKPKREYKRKDIKPTETKTNSEVEPADEVKAHGLEDLC